MFSPIWQTILSFVTAFVFTIANLLLCPEALADGSIPTVLENYKGYQVAVPDWNNITFSKLPPIQQSGWIDLPANLVSEMGYNPSRTWTTGQSIDTIVMLGDLANAFGLQEYSLANIAQITSLSSELLSLKDFQLSDWQTIGSLVEAIPGLEFIPIQKIEPFYDLAVSALGHFNGAKSILSLLDKNPLLGEVPLGKFLDLSKYSLDSIPGLFLTPIKELGGWQQALISGIPGLNQVPFNLFPLTLGSGIGLAAKADVVWGNSETGDPLTGSDRFVSGSGNKGKTVPVACEPGKPCGYLELSGLLGTVDPLHGKRWASVEAPQVEGGEGLLKAVNGGREPPGVLVYGSPFKTGIIKTYEKKGLAEFGLYFRVCVKGALVDLGCTPYFIGPVPWLPVQEGGIVILASLLEPKVQLPERYQKQINELIAKYNPQGTNGGNNGSPSRSNGDLSGCAGELVKASPKSLQQYANKSIPLILEEAKKAGLTPAQTAYVIATAQKESNLGLWMHEIGKGGGRHGKYYGRGFVQITWDYNYRYWSNRLGYDFINNPDLAAKPEIAAKILVYGMRDGTYTGVTSQGTLIPGGGKKLSDYINSQKTDFYNARRIVNGQDDAAEIAQNAQRYYQTLNDCRKQKASTIPPTKTNQAIINSVQKMGNFKTGSGYSPVQTNNGRAACMWAVNQVLKDAGIKPLGNDTLAVLVAREDLKNGRGTLVSSQQAKAGDLMIVDAGGTNQHIGVCLNNGCTRVKSNSSSRASFSWISGPGFKYPGSPYNNGRVEIWRLNK